MLAHGWHAVRQRAGAREALGEADDLEAGIVTKSRRKWTVATPRNIWVATALLLAGYLAVLYFSRPQCPVCRCGTIPPAPFTPPPAPAGDAPQPSSLRIRVVSDMDRDSRQADAQFPVWRALVLDGELRRTERGTYEVEWDWDNVKELKSMHAFNGRGMELSEVIWYAGRLLAFDDVTGIVFDITHGEAVPWIVLVDGDGSHGTKGFKAEWATTKGNVLFVGSVGKEWSNPETGEVVNANPQWIKLVTPDGSVRSVNWRSRYTKLREASNTTAPGYLIHESAQWHERLRKWVFLPRRASSEVYNDKLDEYRGANIMLLASEDFSDVQVVRDVGPFNPTHGFSAFHFVPHHDEEFVALKSEEAGDRVATYITVLNLQGEVLMEEELIGLVKFEGFEFLAEQS